MKIGPFLCAIASVVPCLLACQATAEIRISGTVRDAAGNTVAHAYVEAISVIAKKADGTAGDLPNPWVAADRSGGFSLSLLPGQYRIRAKDEVDGYPDPSFWVNIDPKARFPQITVSDEEIKNVDVILGTQGGILDGDLLDAQSHEAIAGARIRLQDPENQNAYVEIFTDRAGHFHYTVPSEPVLISAMAAGHKTTRFENGVEITLSQGEHRQFHIEMERD